MMGKEKEQHKEKINGSMHSQARKIIAYRNKYSGSAKPSN